MATEDDSARRARAERLRREIDRLKEGGVPFAPPPAPSPPESPADFVHRRMRELDEKKKEE